MKKNIAVVISLLLFCVIGNFSLYYFHVKKIDTHLESAKKEVMDLGMVFSYNKKTTNGILFWELQSILYDVEVYSKKSGIIVYTRIPLVKINSYIKGVKEGIAKVIIGNEIKGYIDLSGQFFQMMDIDTKGDFKITSSEGITFDVQTPLLDGNLTSINLVQDTIDIKYKGSHKAEITGLNASIRENEDRQQRFKTKIQKAILYHEESQYPGSFDLDILKSYSDDKKQTYKGTMDMKNELFSINSDGKLYQNTENVYMSDLKFKIRNPENIFKITESVAKTIGSKPELKIDIDEIDENMKKVQKAIMENSHISGDEIEFTLRDSEKGFLFNEKLFSDVFADVLQSTNSLFKSPKT